MKKLPVLLLVIAMFGATLFITSSNASAAPGDTTQDPILITDCVGLQAMNNGLGKHYALSNDINCSVAPYNTGNGFTPIGSFDNHFTGSLDGQDHVINGLYMINGGYNFGLFSYTAGATIQDLGISNAHIVSGGNAVAILVGTTTGGSITNVAVSGSVTGAANTGGIAGLSITPIANSYSTASVTGTGAVGGLVGDGYSNITSSYASGAVTGTSDTGGLVGVRDGGTVSNSFWDTQTTGQSTTGGGGTGKTTAQMKTITTFTDTNSSAGLTSSWDFEEIWLIDDQNQGYPRFEWMTDPVVAPTPNGTNDLNGDGIIDSTQPNVVGLENGFTTKTEVVQVNDGCTIDPETVSVSQESSLPTQDIAYDYSQGFLRFTAQCVTPGATAHVVLYFYGLPNTSVTARKFLPSSNSYTTITGASAATTTIYGQSVVTVSYDVVDGSAYDSDASMNGTIVDPVGLGTSVLSAPQTGEGGTAK